MSEIYVKENESLDNALKRFKRSCAKSGVLAEVRKREHYESPSVRRRKKSESAYIEIDDMYMANDIIDDIIAAGFGKGGRYTERKT